jgi:hypothetical protein
MADPTLRPPHFEGMGLDPATGDALGSLVGSINELVDELNRQNRANKTIYIPGKGNVGLDRLWEEFGFKSGDVLCTTQSVALIALRKGWVMMDGTNGTQNWQGKYVKGATNDAELKTTGGGTHCHTVDEHDHAPTGTGATADICFAGGGCSCTFAASDHTHNPAAEEPLTDAAAPDPPHGFGYWIMKL